MKALGFFVISVLLCRPALATYLETNFLYFSDTFSAANDTANNRTFLEVVIGFSSDRKGRFVLGWNYLSMSASDTDASAATASFAGTAMGPKLVFFLDRDRNWSLGMGYLLSATASYSASSDATAETWTGSVIKANFGYQYWSGDTWSIGVHLNYAGATYNRQMVDGAYTEEAYTRTFIYPTVVLAVDF